MQEWSPLFIFTLLAGSALLFLLVLVLAGHDGPTSG